MKILITIFVFYLTSSLYAQTPNVGYFKTTYFLNKNTVVKTRTDTIVLIGPLDLQFYKKHFSVPYHIPSTLIDKRYSNTSITNWKDTLKEKNYKENWTYTSTFNSLSQMIKYEYSGCLICALMPFQFKFVYDSQNRLIKIENKNDWSIGPKRNRQSKGSTSQPEEDIHFKYDKSGENIIQIKRWRYKKLKQLIELKNIK